RGAGGVGAGVAWSGFLRCRARPPAPPSVDDSRARPRARSTEIVVRPRRGRRAQDQLRGTRPSAACALALASCFLTSIAGVFDFGDSDGFCLPPGAISPAGAACALPFASGFLTSVAAVFGVGDDDGFCLPPAAVSPAPAACALPLPSCFLTSF